MTQLRPLFAPLLIVAGLWLAAAVGLAAGLSGWDGQPRSAQAQDADLDSLSDRVARLQRELLDLQRAFYKGEDIPAPASLEGDQGLGKQRAARTDLRLAQFEAALQSLTNDIEELGFAIDSVNGRLDRLVADVDFRLQALERRPAAVAGAGDPTSANRQLAGQAPASDTPGTLGTLSQNDFEAFQTTQGTDTATTGQTISNEAVTSDSTSLASLGDYELPEGTQEEQYKYAFSLLRQANYDEAAQAFSVFLTRYPDDPLAGNAKYWLGETHYVRGDYQQAAVTFAEAYQSYPESSKAPDNLLKLALSLASLNDTANA